MKMLSLITFLFTTLSCFSAHALEYTILKTRVINPHVVKQFGPDEEAHSYLLLSGKVVARAICSKGFVLQRKRSVLFIEVNPKAHTQIEFRNQMGQPVIEAFKDFGSEAACELGLSKLKPGLKLKFVPGVYSIFDLKMDSNDDW